MNQMEGAMVEPASPKSIPNDIQSKARSWYRYQVERETLTRQLKRTQEKIQMIREKQEIVEEEIIDILDTTNNQKRPLQIGNDWFCVKPLTNQETPLTYTALEKILLAYFAGDVRRRDDCLHFIRNQRESRISARTIARIAPSPHSPLVERTLSTSSNIDS